MTRFTDRLMRSLPISFDYAVGRQPRVDEVVTRLIKDGYRIFVHSRPGSDLNSFPKIADRACVKWNYDGIGVRVSDPDSYHMLSRFPRRVAVNLQDHVIINKECYSTVDRVLCMHPDMVSQLGSLGVSADIFSYDTMVAAISDLSPDMALAFQDELDLFSVIISTDGFSNGLEYSVRSVRDQVLPGESEIIIVDYGHPSNRYRIREICDRNGARYARLPEEETRTAIAARSKGVEIANNPYVLTLDDDIALSPWYLLTCIRVMRAKGARTIAYASARNFLPTSDISSPRYRSPADESLPAPYGIEDNQITTNYRIWESMGGNLVFHRQVAPDLRRALQDAVGEIDLCYRLVENGFELSRVNIPLCFRLPSKRRCFDPAIAVHDEIGLFERHPRAQLDGQIRLALEPVDAGCVCVIIPVRAHSPRRLGLLFETLRLQEYGGDVEIIVCDYGSPNPEMIRNTCASAEVRYLRVEQAEVTETPANQNLVVSPWVSQVRCNYILLLEQDTLIPPFYIQNCVNILRYHGDNFLCHAERRPLSELLVLDETTPFSRFHLYRERIIDLLKRVTNAERIPVTGLLDSEKPLTADNLFLSRALLERAEGFADARWLRGEGITEFIERLCRVGARPVSLKTLRAYRVGRRGQKVLNSPVHLDENIATLIHGETAWGELGLHGDLGYEDKKVAIQGQSRYHSFSAHAPSRLVFALERKSAVFRCGVAINDGMRKVS